MDHTIKNPLTIRWTEYGHKVNKPEIESAELVSKKLAEELAERLAIMCTLAESKCRKDDFVILHEIKAVREILKNHC